MAEKSTLTDDLDEFGAELGTALDEADNLIGLVNVQISSNATEHELNLERLLMAISLTLEAQVRATQQLGSILLDLATELKK